VLVKLTPQFLFCFLLNALNSLPQKIEADLNSLCILGHWVEGKPVHTTPLAHQAEKT